jgi:hypothetical protein
MFPPLRLVQYPVPDAIERHVDAADGSFHILIDGTENGFIRMEVIEVVRPKTVIIGIRTKLNQIANPMPSHRLDRVLIRLREHIH